MKLASQVKIDSDAVRVLAELLKETDLTEIEYQLDSLKIKVSRTIPQVVVPVSETAVAPANTSAPVNAANAVISSSQNDNLVDHPGVIEAQMVGTVYLSPGPGTDPFITIGDRVDQGQTMFIIEAMKVMNMIKAPRSGVVKHIFVKDGQPVEYGDPIVIVE